MSISGAIKVGCGDVFPFGVGVVSAVTALADFDTSTKENRVQARDKETGLPLKSLLLNDKGQLLERFQFTRLDTAEVPSDSDLQAGSDCKPVTLDSDKASAVKTAQVWHSDWLPPGFELTSSTSHKDPETKAQVNSLMFEDGLARFSVFLEPLNGATVTDTRTQLGPTVAVSRRLTTPQGEMMVTVVGEIPIGTAERIALSMRNDAAATSKQ